MKDASSVAENPVKNILGEAFKSVTDEIEACNKQIEAYTARKVELQKQMQEAMREFQVQLEPAVTKKSSRVLVLEYLNKHKEAKASEIRKYLEENGKDTNPGVVLGRMVKAKTIKHPERGLYKVK